MLWCLQVSGVILLYFITVHAYYLSECTGDGGDHTISGTANTTPHCCQLPQCHAGLGHANNSQLLKERQVDNVPLIMRCCGIICIYCGFVCDFELYSLEEAEVSSIHMPLKVLCKG